MANLFVDLGQAVPVLTCRVSSSNASDARSMAEEAATHRGGKGGGRKLVHGQQILVASFSESMF